MDLRPALAKKNLMECKNGQLQQMRENQGRREAERELDRMWEHVMAKVDQDKVRYNFIWGHKSAVSTLHNLLQIDPF